MAQGGRLKKVVGCSERSLWLALCCADDSAGTERPRRRLPRPAASGRTRAARYFSRRYVTASQFLSGDYEAQLKEHSRRSCITREETR